MPHLRILTLLAAALLQSGCGDLVSLHGLYTAQDNVLDAALEGNWENKDNRLTIERGADFYLLTLQSRKDPSETSKYEMRLVNISGVRFADLLPMDTFVHMFLKV